MGFEESRLDPQRRLELIPEQPPVWSVLAGNRERTGSKHYQSAAPSARIGATGSLCAPSDGRLVRGLRDPYLLTPTLDFAF